MRRTDVRLSYITEDFNFNEAICKPYEAGISTRSSSYRRSRGLSIHYELIISIGKGDLKS